MRPGHTLIGCQVKKPCVFCGKRQNHHRSLCPKKFSTNKEFDRGTNTKSSSLAVLQADKESTSPVLTSTLFVSGNQVLMQTATCKVKNPSQPIETIAKLFLDCGSQRSYVTGDLSEKLHLKCQASESISVHTFGSDEKRLIPTKTSEIGIVLTDEKLAVLKVNIVPCITGNLNNVPVPLAELNPIFTTLKLADDYSNPTSQYVIDVLVGNDYYFELMLPERKQLRPGLFLLNSKLGWILSGRVQQTIAPNYSLH